MDTDYNMLCAIVMNMKNNIYSLSKYNILVSHVFLGRKEIKILKDNVRKGKIFFTFLKELKGLNLINTFFGLKVVEVNLDTFIEVGGINDNT